MEPEHLTRKQWIFLWALPVLFILTVGAFQGAAYLEQCRAKSATVGARRALPKTLHVRGDSKMADTTPPTYDSDTGASVNEAGTQISIPLIEADSTPVLPETGVTGFTVKVNSVARTVSAATITNVVGGVIGYNVSGAGDTEWNGDYLEAGVHASKPYYQLDAEHFLFFDSAFNHCWALGPQLSDTGVTYDGPDTDTPAGPGGNYTWGVDAPEGYWGRNAGTSPAPTVTAITSDPSITADLTIANKIYEDDIVTVEYDGDIGNVTDSASTPNSMASFGPVTVDNGSTQPRPAPWRPMVWNPDKPGILKRLPEGEELNIRGSGGGQINPVTTLTDAETITWNVGSNPIEKATVTLGGNRTLEITGAASGQQGILIVKQDATGSRTLTLPTGSLVVSDGSGSVTLTSDANAVDVLVFLYDGTNYYWTFGGVFS